jgi:hydrogenase nickel incorporation protein HypA/HybF
MHEMALARDVVDLVVDYAQKAGADEVRSVYLTIGAGRDVVEDLFEGVFAYLARNTVAEHAELVIQRTPFMVRCNQCGMCFHINVFDKSSWICPACKAEHDYRLISGMEFQVNRIVVTNRCRSSNMREAAVEV